LLFDRKGRWEMIPEQILTQIDRDLDAEIVLQEEEGHYSEPSESSAPGPEKYYDSIHDAYFAGSGWVVDKPRIAKPDAETRKETRKALKNLLAAMPRETVMEIYRNYGSLRIRFAAGRALGYSWLRVSACVYTAAFAVSVLTLTAIAAIAAIVVMNWGSLVRLFR